MSDNKNELCFDWRVLRSECPHDVAQRILDVAAEMLTAALPRIFGTSEPLRGKLSEVGDKGFVDLWDSGEPFSWRATKPFGYGHTANLGNVGERHPDRISRTLEPVAVGSIKMRCSAELLERDAEREAVRSFFVAISEATNAFFGAAFVERHPQDQRPVTNPSLGGDAFYGLPIGDLWIAYFDSRYHELLHADLALEPVGHGWLFEIPDAWVGDVRTGQHSLLTRVPLDLLQRTSGRDREPGHEHITEGVKLHPARQIPREFSPTNVKYRAMLAATQLIDRSRLVTSLRQIGMQVIEDEADLIVAAIQDWRVRLRSTETGNDPRVYRPTRFYNNPDELPQDFQLAPSIDEYMETWEVSGEFDDPDGSRRQDWLATLAAMTAQHQYSVWTERGPVA